MMSALCIACVCVLETLWHMGYIYKVWYYVHNQAPEPGKMLGRSTEEGVVRVLRWLEPEVGLPLRFWMLRYVWRCCIVEVH